MSKSVRKFHPLFLIKRLAPSVLIALIIACGDSSNPNTVKIQPAGGSSGQTQAVENQANPNSAGAKVSVDNATASLSQQLNDKVNQSANPAAALKANAAAAQQLVQAEISTDTSKTPVQVTLTLTQQGQTTPISLTGQFNTQKTLLLPSDGNKSTQAIYVCQDPTYDPSKDCESAAVDITNLNADGSTASEVMVMIRHTDLDVSVIENPKNTNQHSTDYNTLKQMIQQKPDAFHQKGGVAFAKMSTAEIIQGTTYIRITLAIDAGASGYEQIGFHGTSNVVSVAGQTTQSLNSCYAKDISSSVISQFPGKNQLLHTYQDKISNPSILKIRNGTDFLVEISTGQTGTDGQPEKMRLKLSRKFASAPVPAPHAPHKPHIGGGGIPSVESVGDNQNPVSAVSSDPTAVQN